MSSRFRHQQITVQTGFTLIEVLIAALIVAAFLVPAVQALATINLVGSDSQANAHRNKALESRINVIRALPFDSLSAVAGNASTPGPLSDPPAAKPRILVYVSKFDGDATGQPVTFFDINNVDSNLLWLKVAYADTGHSMATLVLQ